jgi:hypothetical protein
MSAARGRADRAADSGSDGAQEGMLYPARAQAVPESAISYQLSAISYQLSGGVSAVRIILSIRLILAILFLLLPALSHSPPPSLSHSSTPPFSRPSFTLHTSHFTLPYRGPRFADILPVYPPSEL